MDVLSKLNVDFHTVLLSLDDCDKSAKAAFVSTVEIIVPFTDVYSSHPYKTHAVDGRETDPHITVLFGLTKDSDLSIIKDFLSNHGPIEFEIGNISAFRNDDKPYDVLKIEIISPKLEALHYYLRNNFDNECKFPYRPHMTLSYIEKGGCKDIEGAFPWTGKKYECKKLVFSNKNGEMVPLPLYKDEAESSILDIPKKTLNTDLWSHRVGQAPILKTDLQAIIMEKVRALEKGFDLSAMAVHFYGGNASYQWHKGGDVDISVGVSGEDYTLQKMKEIKKIEIDYNGYPIHFFLKADTSVEVSEAVYDVAHNTWIVSPLEMPEGFNVETWYSDEIKQAEATCAEIDQYIGMLNREYKKLKSINSENPDQVNDRAALDISREQAKHKVLQYANFLIAKYYEFRSARQLLHQKLKSSKDPMGRFSPAEITWKYLDKMGYLGYLHELSEGYESGLLEKILRTTQA